MTATPHRCSPPPTTAPAWLAAALVTALGVTLGPAGALAAELTDVVDALDEDNDDPFDFHIEPRFRQRIEQGSVVREANCTPDPNGPPDAFRNAASCPDEATIISTRELDYERLINELDIEFQIGIWHDLEFHIGLPIVVSDTRTVRFAEGDGGRSVTNENSSVDPADVRVEDDLQDGGLFETYRFFDVGAENVGPDRAGIGDVRFGIAWSPYNTEREPYLATLTLGVDYVAPTGEVARRNNTGVGRGLHELQFRVAASRRFPIIEPYFGIEYDLPLPASDSLFENHGGGQVDEGPGMRGEVLAGAELVLYEDPRNQQLFTFDAGLRFGFQAEGRDYTVLSDAFGASSCSGTTPREAGFDLDGTPYEPASTVDADSAACAWILQAPANRVPNPGLDPLDETYVHDGITTVESYATIGARFALNFQISEYVEIRIDTNLETQTEHYITAARTGRDRDGDSEVDFNDPNERSPVYNPTIDGVGQRMRVQSVFNIDWGATLAFQF